MVIRNFIVLNWRKIWYSVP